MIDSSPANDPRAEITHRIEALYGHVDWRAQQGILHVTAIAARDRATIAIGEAAPESATDRFVLGLARARADAIVTTGATLRAEPALEHRYAETPELETALAEWRARVLGRSGPPALIVLSRSGALPEAHPALVRAAAGFVWTSASGRARLGERLGQLEVVVPPEAVGIATDVAVVGAAADSQPPGASHEGLAAALAYALARPEIETLSIEAGPSTTAALYALPAAARGGGVDELLLSLYEGELASAARAPAFVSPEQLRSSGLTRCSSERCAEASGPWRFERYRRDPRGD